VDVEKRLVNPKERAWFFGVTPASLCKFQYVARACVVKNVPPAGRFDLWSSCEKVRSATHVLADTGDAWNQHK